MIYKVDCEGFVDKEIRSGNVHNDMLIEAGDHAVFDIEFAGAQILLTGHHTTSCSLNMSCCPTHHTDFLKG